MANFVEHFHNLEGDLPSDRRKNLNNLLKLTSSHSNQNEIDEALQALHPSTYLEKLFWVETLVHFKKTAALTDILKWGNREFIKIILRQKWFIVDGFDKLSAQELVNDLFPCLSHSTKLKLLRKIANCWCEAKMDELFDAVLIRYGLFIASGLIHACSIPKVKALLSEYEIILNAYQVLHLLNRDEDLFKIYVLHINKLRKKPYTEQSVLNLLAIKFPKLFVELLKSNEIESNKLTKAASICILDSAKEEVSENYYSILNKKALVKKLGPDFRSFYKIIFSKQSCELNLNASSEILKYVSKHQRWDLFVENYHIHFPNKTINESFTILDEATIITLNPSKDVIRSWAEANYKATNDLKYLSFYHTSVSIPILREKINVTSDMPSRMSIIKLLITTCAKNKDMESIDQVLEYIGSRHKNEDDYAYQRIIQFFCESFKEDQLTKNHWDFIHKQQILLCVKGKIDAFTCGDIFKKLLCYYYKNDKEIFKIVATDFVKLVCQMRYTFRLHVEDSKVECKIFGEFCEIIPQILTNEHEHYRSMRRILISEFWEICKLHPEHCLDLREYPYLVSVIQEAYENGSDSDNEYILPSAILYCLQFPQFSLSFLNESSIVDKLSNNAVEYYVKEISPKKNISQIEYKILTAFFEKQIIDKADSWAVGDIVKNVLLYHPRIIFSNFEKVWPKIMLKSYYEIKHYSHFGLDEKMCNYLKENWSKGDRNQRETAIRMLQDLLPDDQFIQFVTQYFEKVDESSDDILKSSILNFIADLLKNAEEPSKLLTLIIKLCSNVDSKKGLSSLYSLFSRSSENMLYPHLETLSKQSLTLAKHHIYLSFELLDSQHIFGLLKAVDSSTGPFRKYLCLAALKYFVKNSSENLFGFVKKYLSMLDKNDRITLSKLVKTVVPKKFRVEYIEICWKSVENVDDEKIKVEKYFDRLLKQLLDKDVIRVVSTSFVNNIINNYLPKQGDGILKNVNEFTVLCLVYKEAERPANFETLFSVLSKLDKKLVGNFVDKYVDFVLENKPNATFLDAFLKNWQKHLSPTDTLDEYITINLLHKFVHQPIQLYAKSIIDYMEQLIAELGPQVFEMYKDNLGKLISKMKNLDQYSLFYVMLSYKSSSIASVLVIQLLTPVSTQEKIEAKNAYRNVLEILNITNEPIVKGYYNIYLKSSII